MKNSLFSLLVRQHLRKGFFQANSTISGLLLLLLLTACQPAAPDYEAQYRPISEGFIQMWNTGDLALVDSIYAATAVQHASIIVREGADEIKKNLADTRNYFKELKLTLEDATYSPGKIAIRWNASGLEPMTGKYMEAPGIGILDVADGKIVTEWMTVGILEPYQKLGFMLTPPPMDSTGTKAGEGKAN